MAKNRREPGAGDSEAGDLLIALSHELRREILQSMADGEAISPKGLSKRLAQPLSNVSYHVRILDRRSAIALVRTEPARGSVKHFYRLSLNAEWALKVLGIEPKTGGEEPTADG
jgi:DNA-binding transcriptional ArsR family regulator